MPLLVCGCGSKGPKKVAPKLAQRVAVQGPWKQGGRIPLRYTCDGDNAEPTISSNTPPGTAAIAVVMTDPDAPGGTFVHWTHWEENTSGRNSFGKVGYSGPCPPKGAKPHHYVITVYALRHPLGLPEGSAPDRVIAALRKDAFASGSLTGLYGR